MLTVDGKTVKMAEAGLHKGDVNAEQEMSPSSTAGIFGDSSMHSVRASAFNKRDVQEPMAVSEESIMQQGVVVGDHSGDIPMENSKHKNTGPKFIQSLTAREVEEETLSEPNPVVTLSNTTHSFANDSCFGGISHNSLNKSGSCTSYDIQIQQESVTDPLSHESTDDRFQRNSTEGTSINAESPIDPDSQQTPDSICCKNSANQHKICSTKTSLHECDKSSVSMCHNKNYPQGKDDQNSDSGLSQSDSDDNRPTSLKPLIIDLVETNDNHHDDHSGSQDMPRNRDEQSRKVPTSRGSQPISPDEMVATDQHKKDAFQPLILSVRGSCTDPSEDNVDKTYPGSSFAIDISTTSLASPQNVHTDAGKCTKTVSTIHQMRQSSTSLSSSVKAHNNLVSLLALAQKKGKKSESEKAANVIIDSEFMLVSRRHSLSSKEIAGNEPLATPNSLAVDVSCSPFLFNKNTCSTTAVVQSNNGFQTTTTPSNMRIVLKNSRQCASTLATSSASGTFLQSSNTQVQNAAVYISQKTKDCSPATSQVPQSEVQLTEITGVEPLASISTESEVTSLSNSVRSNTGYLLGSVNNQDTVAVSIDGDNLKKRIDSIVSDVFNNLDLNRNDLTKSDILSVGCSAVNVSSSLSCFNCPSCGESFSSQFGISYHLKRILYSLEYFCCVCKRMLTFPNKCVFWMHLNKESSNPNIRFENEKGHLLLKLYQYQSVDQSGTIHKSPATCPGCSFKVNSMEELKQHLTGSTDSTSAWACELCEIAFPSLCSLQGHMTIHAGNITDKWCPECGDTKLAGVISGIKSHKTVFDHLDECGHFNRALRVSIEPTNIKFNGLKAAKKHFVESNLKLLHKCKICMLAFTEYSLLREHTNVVHHKSLTESIPSFLCKLCKNILNNEKTLREHMERHYDKSTKTIYLQWKCLMCSIMFDCLDKLKEHAKQEHAHKPKRCTICFRLFSKRQNLVNHIIHKKCQPHCTPTFSHCVDLVNNDALHVSVNYKEMFVKQTSFSQFIQIAECLRKEHDARGTPQKQTSVEIIPLSASSQLHVPSKRKLQDKGHQPKPSQPRKVSTLSPVTSLSVSDHGKHQCHACKIVITGEDNFKEHMKGHISMGKRMNFDVCKCVVCLKMFKCSELTAHLQTHQAQSVIICSRCQRRDFETMAEAKAHSEAYCGYKFVQGSGIISAENEVSCEGTEEIESSGNRENESNSSSALIPCLLCGIAFTDQTVHDEHVSRMHDGTRVVYYCLVCQKKGKVKVFKKKKLVSKHIEMKHRVVKPSSVSKLIKEEEQNVSSGKMVLVSRQLSESANDGPIPKRLRVQAEGDFLCGKCAFSCTDNGEFSKHISTHNTKNEPQCPECGLCFTVVTALNRHLQAVHKIKDIQKYLSDKSLHEIQEDEDEDVVVDDPSFTNENPLHPPISKIANDNCAKKRIASKNPLECNVCYKVFDCNTTLKKHMRNHGMAFIRSKRLK